MGFCDRSMHDCKGRNYWDEFRNEFIEMLRKKNLAQIINETKYECTNNSLVQTV